jgi:serine/threonine protein phosphatase PrpC
MRLNVEGKTHIGLKRKINEDSYLISPELGLYVIADGMGGHRAGEVASRMVVESIEGYWRKANLKENPTVPETSAKDISKKAKHLVKAISLANTVVHEAQKKPEYLRMGSTVSALLVERDTIWSANVGDSPVYILDQGRLRLVSEEHSIEAEQRNMGFSDFFGSTNPLMKNILTRVIGLNEKVDIYIMPMKPEPGDIILACSDGITNYMPEESITDVLNNPSTSLEDKADLLIEGANRGGGGDNITVILVEVLEEGKWDRIKSVFK